MPESNFFQPWRLEPGDARKIEVSDSHRRHQHLAGFGGHGFRSGGKGIDLVEGAQRTLMEAEIPHGGHDFTVFDEKGLVLTGTVESGIRAKVVIDNLKLFRQGARPEFRNFG